MMRGVLLLMLAALLAACGPTAKQAASVDNASSAPDLETAAIAAGVIPDPESTDITGLYARDTDRICVIPDRFNFRIGAYIDYGPNQSCSGSGTATRSGETLHIRFDEAEGCEFDAGYEGDRIVFPGRLPDECGKLCKGRASFAALDVALLSNSQAEASTLRNGKGKILCVTP
jgi:hypothetical protein